MRSPWPYFAAALTLSLMAVHGAHAAEPGVTGRAAKACKADIDSFCAGVKPGEGRIVACLKENRDKLSEDCKTAAKAALAERKNAKQAR